MTGDPTRPLSIRLKASELDALKLRARDFAGAPSAVARDLIRAGLAGGDAQTQAARLLMIERRLAAIDQQTQAIRADAERQAAALDRLSSMFEALLAALAGDVSTFAGTEDGDGGDG